MRCVYCHNPQIVTGRGEKEEEEFFSFLNKRVGKLTAVVFSGGEATLYPMLPDMIRKVKAMGFKVKLDTNGSRPQVVKLLLEEGLLDYVAMDYKCPPDLAEGMIGTAKLWEPFRESLALLINASRKGLAFEVRTTVHPDFLKEEDINRMIIDLDQAGYQGTYYIQNIAATGEKTIGQVAEPQSRMDQTKLVKPKGFELAYRNFS